MPRYCKSCNTSHEKPTGKNCRRTRQEDNSDEVQGTLGDNRAVLEALKEIQDRMTRMETKMESREEDTASEANSSLPNNENSVGRERENRELTPQSLRKDRVTMDAVAAKLAEWGVVEDEAQPSTSGVLTWRAGAKKSGAVSKGTDNIKKVIDWPHFHIRQGPKRTVPTFEEISSHEFVLGFLRMIRDPASKYDKDRMLEVLSDVMEDTIDFGWENAKGFYNMVGQDIEQNKLDWNDKQALLQMRLTHSRTVLPPAQSKPNKPVGSARAKCCAAFQRGTCDQEGNHGPYKHACDYCYRTKNMFFPHPEPECKSKQFAPSKNVQRGDKE